jgi:nuclease A inhibitor-like protein
MEASRSRSNDLPAGDGQPGEGLALHVARALAAVIRGIDNPMSESTDWFRPFVAEMPRGVELTAETFRAAVGIGHRYKIDLESADEFFRANQDTTQGDAEEAPTYVVLEKLMRAVLSDISLAQARGENVVRVRTYLFGRMDDGTLVGLKTMTTET